MSGHIVRFPPAPPVSPALLAAFCAEGLREAGGKSMAATAGFDEDEGCGMRLPGLSDDDILFICRAALADRMGEDIAIIRAALRADGLVETSYVRPTDGLTLRSACQMRGNRLVWAKIDPSGALGPWHVGPGDEVVTFRFEGRSVTIMQDFEYDVSFSETFIRDENNDH